METEQNGTEKKKGRRGSKGAVAGGDDKEHRKRERKKDKDKEKDKDGDKEKKRKSKRKHVGDHKCWFHAVPLFGDVVIPKHTATV